MIEVKITKEMIENAKSRDSLYQSKFGIKGTLLVNKNSHIRLEGYLAEEIIKTYFKNSEYSNNTEYDFLIDNKKVEVKSISTNTEPKPYYDACVMKYQENRVFDYFIFLRIKNDYSTGWILGTKNKEEYFKLAKFNAKGTKNNNFIYDNDRYSLQIKYLDPIKKAQLNPFRGEETGSSEP